MKIISWNVSYMKQAGNKIDYLKEKMDDSNCIVILQEVTHSFYNTLVEKLTNYNVEYSLNYRPIGKYDPKARGLGIAIVTSKDIEVINAKVYDRALLPERTLLVDLKIDNKIYKVLGLHSITGCDYRKAKSLQFLNFAELVDDYKPDIIGIDANDPKDDCYSIDNMIFFDNKDKGDGARKFFNIVKENNLVDSYIIDYDIEDYIGGLPLVVSYRVNGVIEKRYDFVFLNKDKFKEYKTTYSYESSIEAGSDHALIEVIEK